MKSRNRNIKRGPKISPIKEQGMLVDIGQRVTFSFGDGRSLRCELKREGDQIMLACNSHPGMVVIWPYLANEVGIIVSRQA